MKSHIVPVRFDEREFGHLKSLCAASDMTMSMIIRKAVAGSEIKSKPPEGLMELYREINRIGVNVNQIVRKANAGIVTRNDVRELLFLMRKIESRMARIADY